MKGQKLLKIGEIAGAAGVTVRTVRYYDEMGLLSPSNVSPGGFRLYTSDDLQRLIYVRRFKELGFSLDEIITLLRPLDTLESREQRINISMDLLEKQLIKTEKEISKLREIRGGILHAKGMLKACKRCETKECPPDCHNKKAMV